MPRYGRAPWRHLPNRRHMRWPSKLIMVAALGVLTVAVQPGGRAIAADADLYVNLRYEVDGAVGRCWDEAEFRRSVVHRVGYDPFRDSASVRVSIRVGGSARAVDGQVEWRNADGVGMGERRFVAKDGNCLRLLTEMSFAVGLQIELLRPKAAPVANTVSSAGDGAASFAGGGAASSAGSGSTSSASASILTTGAATRPFASSPPPPPPATQPPAGPPTTAPKPDIATSEKGRPPSAEVSSEVEAVTGPDFSHWPMWLGIGPSLAMGIAPSATGSARLFFGARRSDLSIEVGAEASYPSTERQWDGSGFRQSLLGASAALCGHRQSLSACVLGKASQVRVSGLGVDQPRSPTGYVVHAGLRIAATLALGGSWSATAHLDALGLLTPCTVDLNKVGVWEMPRLGALAGIDVSVRFR